MKPDEFVVMQSSVVILNEFLFNDAFILALPSLDTERNSVRVIIRIVVLLSMLR